MILRDNFLSSSSHDDVHFEDSAKCDIVEDNPLLARIIDDLKSLGRSADKIDTKEIRMVSLAEKEWVGVRTTKATLSIISGKSSLVGVGK